MRREARGVGRKGKQVKWKFHKSLSVSGGLRRYASTRGNSGFLRADKLEKTCGKNASRNGAKAQMKNVSNNLDV
jgi:hypothetical protein